MDSHYEEFYGCEGSFENKFFAKASRHLLKISKKYLDRLARFKQSGKLLDLGCGRGEFIHIAQRLGRYECVGLDVSARVAREAKELFGVEVIVGNFNAGLFKDEKFDVVYMRHIIEHIPDPGQFVADIKAVCAPGAVVAVHLPNDLSFSNAFKRFIYPFRILKEC
ncbi:MAG TPA: class I SAM-dependent methyltransferase, partial [archaeon]|nr:class I SAM-dependent methyltransferase [archaeon]